MTPRHQKIMDLLSSGQPISPTELRRESGLSTTTLHRILIQLVDAGKAHVVLEDEKQCYAKSTGPLPTLETAWARGPSQEGMRT
jgi:predicted HTH transcriptional regulator